VLLAGTSAGLQKLRGTSAPALARFLLTRGLFLVVFEMVVVAPLIWLGLPIPFGITLQVIWALGIGMIVLAALQYLPMRVVAAIGLVIVATHNLLDPIQLAMPQGSAAATSPLTVLWLMVHQTGPITEGGAFGPSVYMQYPALPWLGLMAAGYGLAELYGMEARRRRQLLVAFGAGAAVLFVALRLGNLYGDPQPWTAQDTPVHTLMHFFNVQKYPPSLLYLCATLTFTFVALAWADQRVFAGRVGRALVTYGRVPLFFYVLQWPWTKLSLLAMLAVYGIPEMKDGMPVNFGGPIWFTYVCWAVGAVALYWPCRWYAQVKARRRDLTILRYV
jgi:uncharacterized membrane protein